MNSKEKFNKLHYNILDRIDKLNEFDDNAGSVLTKAVEVAVEPAPQLTPQSVAQVDSLWFNFNAAKDLTDDELQILADEANHDYSGLDHQLYIENLNVVDDYCSIDIFPYNFEGNNPTDLLFVKIGYRDNDSQQDMFDYYYINRTDHDVPFIDEVGLDDDISVPDHIPPSVIFRIYAELRDGMDIHTRLGTISMDGINDTGLWTTWKGQPFDAINDTVTLYSERTFKILTSLVSTTDFNITETGKNVWTYPDVVGRLNTSSDPYWVNLEVDTEDANILYVDFISKNTGQTDASYMIPPVPGAVLMYQDSDDPDEEFKMGTMVAQLSQEAADFGVLPVTILNEYQNPIAEPYYLLSDSVLSQLYQPKFTHVFKVDPGTSSPSQMMFSIVTDSPELMIDSEGYIRHTGEKIFECHVGNFEEEDIRAGNTQNTYRKIPGTIIMAGPQDSYHPDESYNEIFGVMLETYNYEDGEFKKFTSTINTYTRMSLLETVYKYGTTEIIDSHKASDWLM